MCGGGTETPAILSAGANAGQTLRDARIQTHNRGGELIHRGDESQSDGRHNQGVLDQILAVFVADKPYRELLQKLHH
jgi:hypothetical protein